MPEPRSLRGIDARAVAIREWASIAGNLAYERRRNMGCWGIVTASDIPSDLRELLTAELHMSLAGWEAMVVEAIERERTTGEKSDDRGETR